MPIKILLIDDTDADRKITRRLLAKAGYENVIMAESGEDGIAKAAAENPDVVITDTSMPGVDGFEACRRIREAAGPDRPKIIVTTGAIDAVDAIKARKSGADDYCVKTSDAAELIAAIKNVAGES